MAGNYGRPLAERFWEKVEILGPDDCWPWLACRDADGYGRIGVGGRHGGTERAYRVAYKLIYGPIPAGHDIRHFVCDNPPCCNFMHLLAGDRKANVGDMMSRGRYKNAPRVAPDLDRPRWEPPPPPEYTCLTCGLIFSVPSGKRRTGRHTYCSRAHYFAAKEFRLAERFWEKVDRRGPDECWPWKAALDEGGYGQIGSPGGGMVRAHRVAWEFAHGPVPPGLRVRHFICDNRPCCNVAHMRLGTAQQNSDDMVRKGRQASGDRTIWYLHPDRAVKGAAHPNSKLTDEDVKEIRRRYAAGSGSFKTLGQDFGVCAAVVSRIVRRVVWRHVGGS